MKTITFDKVLNWKEKCLRPTCKAIQPSMIVVDLPPFVVQWWFLKKNLQITIKYCPFCGYLIPDVKIF